MFEDFEMMDEVAVLEAPVDKIQWTEIGETLCGFEELRLDRWNELSLTERLDVLQRIENEAARIAHRPACAVKADWLPETTNGHFIAGDGITLNYSRLHESTGSQPALDQLLETLLHEGRHAYQHYNISTCVIHSSPAQVRQWAENWAQYFDGNSIEWGGRHIPSPFLRETEYRLYYLQPLETDARQFAAEAVDYFFANR